MNDGWKEHTKLLLPSCDFVRVTNQNEHPKSRRLQEWQLVVPALPVPGGFWFILFCLAVVTNSGKTGWWQPVQIGLASCFCQSCEVKEQQQMPPEQLQPSARRLTAMAGRVLGRGEGQRQTCLQQVSLPALDQECKQSKGGGSLFPSLKATLLAFILSSPTPCFPEGSLGDDICLLSGSTLCK